MQFYWMVAIIVLVVIALIVWWKWVRVPSSKNDKNHKIR